MQKPESAFKMKFAPLRVPFDRRKQTAAVTLWIALVPGCIALFLTLLFSFEALFPILMGYMIFVYLDPAPEMGGRKNYWFRSLSIWSYMSDFFPTSTLLNLTIELIKTVDLDPRKNYVFGYHPHGIIGLGAWINFATEACGFSNMFHGIDIHLLTLTTNFNAPFFRDILMALGICSVSRKSCENILTAGPGGSLMIVVGGAQEAMYSFPGTNDLVIKKRLGFIKLALRNGAPLVPVYGFGETDLWDQIPNPPGSLVYKFQMLFKKWFTFVPALFHGRGIFTYNYGLLPHRRSIVTVVGNPIEVPKIANPTLEETLHYQKLYLDELQRIFDLYKDEYQPNRVKDLCFVH